MKKGVIKISKKKITKEMFVNELVRLYNEFGKVNIKIWNEHTVYKGSCFNWYLHQYGKIRTLLNEVGIKYINYNELTEEQVLEKAKCIYQEYGYINKILCEQNGLWSSPVRHIFGNYNNLFKAINAPINMPRGVTKDELVSDIKEFIQKYRSYSAILYRKYGKYSCAIVNKYGGWESILNELGIRSTRNSQSENFIETFLEQNQIEFEIHKSFEWLISPDGYKMYVDFFLTKYNLVIEYDGEQHYKMVKYFHKTQENFEKCCERDRQKAKLLEAHGIKIYRIIYSDNILFKLQELLELLD